MYAGVDIGGSKTLVAVLDDQGVIVEREKFPTPKKYPELLQKLATIVDNFSTKDFKAAGIGMPVTHFDRSRGIGISFSNLPWKNIHLQEDAEKIFRCPVALENDAKLACLSEAMLLEKYSKVLYVTVSTGIGYALTVDRKIDTNIGDGGGRLLLLEYRGKLTPWESFASGHAIVERFGKMAADITDTATWKRIAYDIGRGLIELIAVTEPDVIVIGGSVGTHFNKYAEILKQDLQRYETPLLPIPEVRQAARPEEAVIYGCYDFAKERYGH